MGAQAKIINMMLYDGSLNGVIRIEDSNWNAGELFSSPRESVSDLIKTGACNKYGVYLLISSNMVYIGQSSDLSRRLTQHIAKKDWWEQAVIITTKDDSLNHSDIDYLESVLIDKAMILQKLDCDNKKSGNPPKVDIFRKEILRQYLNEALFLMRLIGVHVFDNEKNHPKKRKVKDKSPKTHIEICTNVPVEESQPTISAVDEGFALPSLPDSSLKIGAFVYESMKNLSSSGFAFSEEQINEMCSSEWTKKTMHTIHPFMKRYSPGIDNKGVDGYIRFKKDPYSFGDTKVLISKEWYESKRKYFIDWYRSLEKQPDKTLVQSKSFTNHIETIPSLPDRSLKAGQFVRQAMEALADSGYVFSDETIAALCEENSMKTILGMQRNLPFFKHYDPNIKQGHIINGRPRFYSKPIAFGKHKVYLNSQIYESDKDPFIKWYENLH